MSGEFSPRKVNLLFVAFLLLAIAFNIIGTSVSGSPALTNQRLKATIEIQSLKTCGHPRSRTYQFSGLVRIRFTDIGVRNLIISREIQNPDFQFAIARDEKSMAANIFEYTPDIFRTIEVTPSNYPAPSDAYLASLTADERDVPSEISWFVLAPGDSFVSDAISFGIAEIPTDDPAKFPSGFHVVQFTINTWNVPDKSPEQTCQKWNWFGDCIYNPIRTEPGIFNVPPLSDMPDCK